jgi:hypothetical protein
MILLDSASLNFLEFASTPLALRLGGFAAARLRRGCARFATHLLHL